MATARIAQSQDADAAVHVLRRSITESCVADHRNDRATLEKWLENKTVENFHSWVISKNNFCVVTELDGQVTGVGLINQRGEIQLCYVNPDSQRRGCGRAILSALEHKARAWGVRKVHLSSTLSARRFYEAHGYVSAGVSGGGFGLSCCYRYKKDLQE